MKQKLTLLTYVRRRFAAHDSGVCHGSTACGVSSDSAPRTRLPGRAVVADRQVSSFAAPRQTVGRGWRGVRRPAHNWLLWLSCLLFAGSAWACNVPVFRYALERWVPDNFVITTPAEPTNLVAALRSAPLNLLVESGSATNAAVYLPQAPANQPPLWSGAFTADNVRLLVDSPARREIVRQIQQGASAVWVLLESGNPAADAAAATLLGTELPKLTKELKIPEVDPDDPRTEGNVKLKIAFPMIRVSRTEPAEQLFIRMLLSGNAELDPAKGPIVFPVFGRGRALYGLAGKELTPANIEDTASFLCGACSCEVKELNPGWDLLLAADWDALIDNPVVKDPELPPLISLSALAASAQPQPAVAQQPAPPSADNALSRNLLLVIAVVVLVALAGTIIVKRKS